MEIFTAETILALREKPSGAPLRVLPEAQGSTNTLLRTWAEAGAPDGSAVLAGAQSGGRGRMGRTFFSPPGGLYLSHLRRPAPLDERIARLTVTAAVAALEAVKAVCGVALELKWVNDLMWRGRKLGGILAERAAIGAGSFVLLGVGLNVRPVAFPPELAETAGTLDGAAGREIDRAALAAALLDALERPRDWHDTLARYRQACATPGQTITVRRGLLEENADALAVTDTGGLLVRYADGREEELSSGEVSVRKREG